MSVAAKVSRGRKVREEATIAAALQILKRRLSQGTERYQVNHPGAVQKYLWMHLGELDREAFVVVFVDAQLRAIAVEELFRGTLRQTSVYPREIARAALRHNAASVILAHNHPSGVAEFSPADRVLTEEIRDTLRLFDVTLNDHLLVAGRTVASYATDQSLRDAELHAQCERVDRERRARTSE